MTDRPNLTQLSKEIDDDEYIEESRCVRCDNLGMCDICYRQSIL